MDEELARRVVELAASAPSVQNTQPWRFVASSGGLDLYADRSRQLPALDPIGRQLVISCGAALGLAELATAASGFRPVVVLLPDDGDLDHLARMTTVGADGVDKDVLALVRAIGRRRTVRERFDPVPLTPTERAVLGGDGAAYGGWLRWLDDDTDRVALAVLSDRADRIEHADRAIRAELARAEAHLVASGALRSSDLPTEALDGSTVADPQHLPLPPERPDLAVLGTRYDGPTSWLQAGQAMSRVLLRATGLGLAVSPVGQALDLPWTRGQLRAQLRLTGHPQLVLRLGHARCDAPAAPRRPVDELLRTRR